MKIVKRCFLEREICIVLGHEVHCLGCELSQVQKNKADIVDHIELKKWWFRDQRWLQPVLCQTDLNQVQLGLLIGNICNYWYVKLMPKRLSLDYISEKGRAAGRSMIGPDKYLTVATSYHQPRKGNCSINAYLMWTGCSQIKCVI